MVARRRQFLMRLLANENIPLTSVFALRESGYDVVSISERCPGDDDERVLNIAHEEKRVVITFDRDYGALIFEKRLPFPAGVLLLRFQPVSPLEPAQFVARLLSLGIDLNGNFTTGDRNRVRQRPLHPAHD